MRRLREKFDGLSMRAVQQAGGPSDSLQTRVENGPTAGDGEVLISEETMRKYATAYIELSEIAGRGGGGGVGRHRFDVDESFIMALGAAGSAAADIESMSVRHWEIADEARKTALNTMVIGANLHYTGMVTAGRLERVPPHMHRHIAEVEFNADPQGFGRTMVTVAYRHPTVSITHTAARLGGVGGAPLHAAWPDLGAVTKQAHGRLDPIDSLVTGLESARRRAEALNVDAADVEAVGSMIFLINVLSDQLNAENAEGQEHIGPLETWRRYENSKRWDMLRELLPEQVAGAMPRTDVMVAATSEVLRPWVLARSMPPFELNYAVTPGKPIEWFPTELRSDSELDEDPGYLWVVDKEVLPAVQGLIANTYRFALVLSDTYITTTDTDSVRDSPHYWCPSGIHDDIVLIYHPLSGWRATQID